MFQLFCGKDKKEIAGGADFEREESPATTHEMTDIKSGGENVDVADKEVLFISFNFL